MSQFTPAQVFTPLTPLGEADAAVRQMQANRQAAEFGFTDAFLQAFAGGPTGAIIRRAQSFGFDFDPAFSLDQMKLDDLTSPRYGVDRDLWENYAHAVSEKHLDFIHENNMIVMEKRRVLSGTGGVGGFAGQMIGSLADPGSVAVGLLTGGGSTVARMSLAGRAAFGATVAGGSNIALTSFQAAEDPAIGGSDILKAGLSGVGFGIAGGLTGPLGRLQRAGSGAVGQAAGPLMVDLWGNQDRAQTLMDLGTNLAFGGLFNAIHGPAARPEQVRMAEAWDTVGRRMVGEGTGQPVDYASSTPGLIDIVDPESLKHPFPMEGFPADAVSGKPYSQDAGILGPRDLAQSGRVISSKVFGNERDARVYAQAVPGATVQNVLGTWTVLQTEGGASLSRNSNLRLTPADIAVDLGLRGVIEDLSARGMTAGEIWGMIDGLDVAPRYDAETGRQFIDSARRDLRVPSRNKPEEVASWAQRKGLDTTPLDGDGAAAFRSGLDTRIQQEIARKNPNKSLATGSSPSEGGNVASQPPQKTLGAATPTDTSQPGLAPTTDPTDLDLSELTRLQQTTPKAAYSAKANIAGVDIGLMRHDMVGMVGGSEIPEFRAAARGIGLDWLPDETGAPVTYSAAEWVVDRHKTALANAYLPADRAFHDHRKAGGKMTRDEFDTAIGRALRRPEETPADPQVAAATKAYRAVLDEIHARAVRHEVDIGYTPGYVPRRWSPEAIDALSAEIGAKLMPGRDQATQFAAGREAVTAHLAAAIERAIEPTRGTVTIAGKSSPGWIREGSDQARARAEAIVQNGGRTASEDPTAKRIVMDETHQADIALPDGSTYRLAVEDLLENNAAVLLSGYSHRLHGKMAVARLAKVFGTNMDGSLEVVEGITGIVNRLGDIARERGIPEGQYAPDLAKIERMLKLAAGVPVYEHTTGTRIMDAIRKIGMVRTMSNVGSALNNQVELIHAMAELGSANVLARVVPAYREVINLARTGQQGPQMARDLERIGIAIDRVTSRILPRRGEELGQPVGRSAAEVWLARGERFAFDASLQSVSTDAARLATGMAFMDRWAELAHAGKGFSESRLAQMGLNPQQAEGIMAQIKQHAVWADQPGGRLDHLGLDQWDPFLRRAYEQAASRTVRRLVLENNPTSYSKWMTTPVGKVLAQLRTFAFGAHTAKFLAEVQQRDATTAYTIAFTTIGAASLYTARVMMDAAVQKDKQKYLADRLAPDKVMKAAYSRAAYSALFPTAIDTLWSDMGRQDPIFSFARTSGLRGGGVIGNPTVDFLNEAGFSPLDFDPLRVPRAIAAPVIPGYEFSRQDWRALKSGLAIPDVLNLRKLMDRYAEDLPATSK